MPTTTILLIRHGANDLVGKTFAGRMPGVHLNAEGQVQAEKLAQRLAHSPIAAIYSSPLERARETAAPLSARLGLPVTLADELQEIDVGDWTGRELADIDPSQRWKRFNVFRSGVRAPHGEWMLEVQARMADWMLRMRDVHPDATIAAVGHADPIRAALTYFLGMPLDLFLRLEISPASVSAVAIDDWGPRVLRLNDTGQVDRW